jgi:hypothetical protein
MKAVSEGIFREYYLLGKFCYLPKISHSKGDYMWCCNNFHLFGARSFSIIRVF